MLLPEGRIAVSHETARVWQGRFGAHAINGSQGNVDRMPGSGVLGCCMTLYDFQHWPVITGIILSRLLDDNWRRAIIPDQESLAMLLQGIVTSPLSLVLLVSVLAIIASKTPLRQMLFAKKA